MGRIDGKVAIVTGGAKGIGRGICRLFAREGASVVVADIAEEEGEQLAADLESLGGAGVFLFTDVRQKEDVMAMVDTALQSLGRLDILVNNANKLAPSVKLEDKSDEMFDDLLHVGLYATLWAMQAAMPIMKAQGGGRIINLYSRAATNGQFHTADYNATKAAIGSLTLSAAAEWSKYNILCNAIAPRAASSVYYEMRERGIPGLDDIIASMPMGRLGDPEEDIAPVALFLATKDSQFVNGQVIYVDGGVNLDNDGIWPEESAEAVQRWLKETARVPPSH
jgi:NAD(P)-dependent dehydrogenase (short-subunit alcohol dehydrogenase family)